MGYKVSYKVVSDQGEQLKKVSTDMDNYISQLDQIVSKLGNDELLRTARENLKKFRRQLEDEKVFMNLAGQIIVDAVQCYVKVEKKNVQRVDRAKAHNRDFYKRPVVVASAGAAAGAAAGSAGYSGGSSSSAAAAAAASGRGGGAAAAAAASASSSSSATVKVNAGPSYTDNSTVEETTVIYQENVTNVYMTESAPAADVSGMDTSAVTDIPYTSPVTEDAAFSSSSSFGNPFASAAEVGIASTGAAAATEAVESGIGGLGAAGIAAAVGAAAGAVAGAVTGIVKKKSDNPKPATVKAAAEKAPAEEEDAEATEDSE